MAVEINLPFVASYDVKAHLLPVSRFESLLEKLIELLPRQKKQVALTPIQEIEVLSLNRGEFKSTGNTPTFTMDLVGGVKRGWYYLEAALTRNNGSRVATIVVDVGNHKQKLLIPSILRGSIREVIFLPEGVTQLTWIPTAAPGFFSQSPLQLHQISRIESIFRRAYRVIYDLWRFRHIPPAGRAGLVWTSLLSNLQDGYENSAKLRIQRLSGNDYAAFIAQYDTLTASGIRSIRCQIRALARQPLFSIVMPLHEVNPEQLHASLVSIAEQLYGHWELIIACSPGVSDSALAVLRTKGGNNLQTKIVYLEAGDSPALETADLLNCALAEAQGEWLIRVNPHDCLPKHALFHLANECISFPDALFIYGDDDDIGLDGRRAAPRFKPDWNPDLLTSHDYIGNPATYLRTRLVELGGYAKGFEGAEGYELALRYLKDLPDCQIRHVSKVLYHRHTHPSHAQNLQLAHDAGRLALERYFQGNAITVENGPAPTLYRVKHPLPSLLPFVSIIVPTRDKVSLLQACIQSVQQKTNYPSWELLIVDNGSVEPETQAYFEKLKNDLRIRVLRYDGPFNYSAINNYAVTQARGEILTLLNNDIEVISENWLSEMVSHASRPEVGAVGAKLLYPDGTVQHAGVVLGIGGVAGHVHRFLAEDALGYCHRAVIAQNFSAVTGACLVVRKELYKAVNGLNEEHLHVAFNDIDFCLKLVVAGYKNVFTPFALLYHHESISRGPDDTPEKKAIFSREVNYMKDSWRSRLKNDFAYNQNLSIDVENFSLKI